MDAFHFQSWDAVIALVSTGPDQRLVVMTATGDLGGQGFMASSGGQGFRVTPAMCFFVGSREHRKKVSRSCGGKLSGGQKNEDAAGARQISGVVADQDG
jgi:hypothetical protein